MIEMISFVSLTPTFPPPPLPREEAPAPFPYSGWLDLCPECIVSAKMGFFVLKNVLLLTTKPICITTFHKQLIYLRNRNKN